MTFSAPWWLLLVALVEHTSAIPILSMPVGFASLALGTLLVASNLWNDRAKFRLFAPFVLSLTAPLLALNRLALGDERWAALAVLSAALVALFWGHAYRRRSALRHYGKQWRVPRLSALERAWRRDLPVGQCGVLVVAACAALACLFHCDDRLARYAMAVAPLIAGAALVPLADCASRRPLQLTALAAMTFGAVLLASAELSTAQMAIDAFHLPIRATLALGMTVFLHGWLLPRVLSAESAWHEAIRTAAATTSALAMGAFAWLISTEATRFIPDVGCGVPFVAAAAVSAVIGGMIAGLIAIAVLPKHDPLALSLEGRKGYVYLAQAVAAALVVHLYLTLPWLFQLGIRQYWPYLAMTLAFGGVGMANLLSKRKLLVLSEPIFHAAAALPIVAACAFWGIDSKADASLLMLFAGLVYLVIGVSRHALWSGLAAVAFANLSLWLFYDKFPGMAFLTHPQLWLIPPAVSVLIAAQLNRDRFAAGQLSALRYVCAAIIYLSSTSEIITSGWGAALWPPMGLAALAVAGILAGMLLQTRPFLYLGSAFLLFAMISMVAHAQQRLHHVWPWWAFGLCLGAAILAMFGLFEKRRNDMQSIFNRLREWD
jgi:hypothetical protein